MDGVAVLLGRDPECPWCEHGLHMLACECGCETSARGAAWAHSYDYSDEEEANHDWTRDTHRA